MQGYGIRRKGSFGELAVVKMILKKRLAVSSDNASQKFYRINVRDTTEVFTEVSTKIISKDFIENTIDFFTEISLEGFIEVSMRVFFDVYIKISEETECRKYA